MVILIALAVVLSLWLSWRLGEGRGYASGFEEARDTWRPEAIYYRKEAEDLRTLLLTKGRIK